MEMFELFEKEGKNFDMIRDIIMSIIDAGVSEKYDLITDLLKSFDELLYSKCELSMSEYGDVLEKYSSKLCDLFKYYGKEVYGKGDETAWNMINSMIEELGDIANAYD